MHGQWCGESIGRIWRGYGEGTRVGRNYGEDKVRVQRVYDDGGIVVGRRQDTRGYVGRIDRKGETYQVDPAYLYNSSRHKA